MERETNRKIAKVSSFVGEFFNRMTEAIRIIIHEGANIFVCRSLSLSLYLCALPDLYSILLFIAGWEWRNVESVWRWKDKFNLQQSQERIRGRGAINNGRQEREH